MADVCEKHNVKLLTYGTVVRDPAETYFVRTTYFLSFSAEGSSLIDG